MTSSANAPYLYACFIERDSDAVKPILNYLEYRTFRLQYPSEFSTDDTVVANMQRQIEQCHTVMAFLSAEANNEREFRNVINYALSLRKEIILIYLEDTPLAKGMALQLCDLFALRRSSYAHAVSFQSAIASIGTIQCCKETYTEKEREEEFVPVTPQTPQHVISKPTKAPPSEITEEDRQHARECFYNARNGDAQAQYELGYCYDRGEGVVQDHEKAMFWFLKAAMQEHDEACYELGMLYHYGEGVEQNYAKAVYWYEKAAKRGHAMAQNSLGNRYLYGEGVEENDELAVHWYSMSADQDNRVAMYNLGRCYKHGWGVPEDIEKAIEWHTKAAKRNYSNAQYELSCIYCDRGDRENELHWLKLAVDNGSDKAMNLLGYYYGTGEVVEKDCNLAFSLYLKAAEQDNEIAQYNVGLYYQNGNGVEKNTEQMLYWYIKAAENGHKRAAFRLGEYYENTENDLQYALAWFLRAKELGHEKADKAIERVSWYSMATDQGDRSAMYNLGRCYQNGTGVPKDIEKAFEWYTQAAKQEHADAQYELSCIYLNREDRETELHWLRLAADNGSDKAMTRLGYYYGIGEIVEKDLNRAFQLYIKAAEKGNKIAQYDVGLYYQNGYSVEKNTEKAIEWYTRSAKQEYSDAQYKLSCIYLERKDRETELYWLRLAADNGYNDAMNRLGCYYGSGEVVEQDRNRAFELFLKAAQKGNKVAQFNTGLYYQNGFGTEKNTEQMLYWYIKAAENGHKRASFRLGDYYEKNEKDLQCALTWYLRAKDLGHENADTAIERVQGQLT